MGLQNNQSSGVFLQISNGKLVRQFKQPTDKSVARINKLGREVHEEFYDSLTGHITEVKTKDGDYGKSWVVTMKDGEGTYFLDIKYSSGYAVSLLKALPNANLDQLLTLTPKLNIDGEKKQSVIFINQNGAGLKHFWTKDNPRDLPQMKKIKVKGVETWDDTERMEYLEKFISHLMSKKATEEDVPF